MGSDFKTGLRYSVAFHGLLFFLMAGGLPMCGGSGNGPGGKQGQKQAQNDKKNQPGFKKEEVEVTIIPRPKQGTDKGEALDRDGLLRKIHNAQNCPSFFGGVGIVTRARFDQLNGDTRVVTFIGQVYPDYPAARAGLQEGDQILSDPSAIRGEIGTHVYISVVRGGEVLNFDIVREKICTEKNHGPGEP